MEERSEASRHTSRRTPRHHSGAAAGGGVGTGSCYTWSFGLPTLTVTSKDTDLMLHVGHMQGWMLLPIIVRSPFASLLPSMSAVMKCTKADVRTI